MAVHGGPDFDHFYFLPELDRLADSFRLVYYDQRGRGRSAAGVRPEDVTLRSDDRGPRPPAAPLGARVDRRARALVGRRRRDGVRDPASRSGLAADPAGYRSRVGRRLAEAAGVVRPSVARPRIRLRWPQSPQPMRIARGDLEAEAAYYRIHFRMTLRRPDLLDALVARLRAQLHRGRRPPCARDRGSAVRGDHPARRTSTSSRRCDALAVPTLVLHGEHDFVPGRAGRADRRSGSGSTPLGAPGCGHFTYLEAPEAVFEEISRFCG